MRLIDANELLRALALEPMENRTYWRANEIVLDQPIAYDIDKVVEQLEENYSCDVGNLKMISLDKAIEIVRRGEQE